MTRFVLLFMTLVSTVLACSEKSSFKGESSPPPSSPELATVPVESVPVESFVAPETTQVVAAAAPVEYTFEDFEEVEGQEVVTTCKSCMSRAREIAVQNSLNFTPNIRHTINMLFFKILPEHNLCDIHFRANSQIQPALHEGHDTVFPDQIVLYCPCDCGWAEVGND